MVLRHMCCGAVGKALGILSLSFLIWKVAPPMLSYLLLEPCKTGSQLFSAFFLVALIKSENKREVSV